MTGTRGDGVNLDGQASAHVRRFFIENALMWVVCFSYCHQRYDLIIQRQYHFDGLRLDATHALEDRSQTHFLCELATTVKLAAQKYLGKSVLIMVCHSP